MLSASTVRRVHARRSLWSAMPVAGRRVAPRRAGDDRSLVEDLRALVWSDAQVAAFQRADRLRAYGAHSAAEDLVAREVVIPSWVQADHLHVAEQLDVARWFAAFTGRPWNGSLDVFKAARRRATRVRNASDSPHATPWQHCNEYGVRAFQLCHLLVEPLHDHPCIDELRDFTRLVGWPQALDVGHLEWDSATGFCCCYCNALLFPCESERVPQSNGAIRGLHCCAKGLVHSCARLVITHFLFVLFLFLAPSLV